jgi:hypothetical protein
MDKDGFNGVGVTPPVPPALPPEREPQQVSIQLIFIN